MANLKEIRLRIGAVKNTRKITQAMSRIASARLTRAQNAMTSARAYGERMKTVVAEAVGGVADPAEAHALLEQRAEITGELIVVVTSDRGLCGAFNTNASRIADRLLHDAKREGREAKVITVGTKAASYLKHRGYTPVAAFAAPTPDTVVSTARDVVAHCKEHFLGTGDTPRVDKVHLVYNRFKNVITQEVVAEPLLPVVPAEADVEAGESGTAVRTFEPNLRAVLDHLVPVAVETQLQQAFFNSAAAELAARRQAMDSATDNAGELINDLTLLYNRERQAAITTELMEITGGAEALKG